MSTFGVAPRLNRLNHTFDNPLFIYLGNERAENYRGGLHDENLCIINILHLLNTEYTSDFDLRPSFYIHTEEKIQPG